MTALSDLLNEANKIPNLSVRQIAIRAGERGHQIGHDTVARYMGGRHPRSPSEPVLEAFVAVFPSLSMAKVREAADLPTEVTPVDLPPEAARLTPRQWAAVRELILSMVNPAGRGEPVSEGLAYDDQQVTLMTAQAEHDPRRQLSPETGDPEDVEDWLAANTDVAFAHQRAVRNKDPETGSPLDVHDLEMVTRWLAAEPDGLDVNDPDDVRDRLEEIAAKTGQRSPVGSSGNKVASRRGGYALGARQTGRLSKGQQQALDDAAAESLDTNHDDMEPR